MKRRRGHKREKGRGREKRQCYFIPFISTCFYKLGKCDGESEKEMKRNRGHKRDEEEERSHKREGEEKAKR